MRDGDQREVARGSVWSASSLIIGTLTGPLISVLLVRSMSHRGYGILSLGADAVSLIATLASFGLAGALTQLLSAEGTRHGLAGERAVVRLGMRVTLWASATAVPLTAAAALLFLLVPHLRPATTCLLVMSPIAVLAPFQGLVLGAYRAFGWRKGLASVITGAGLGVGAVVLAVVLNAAQGPTSIAAAFDTRTVVYVLVGLPPLVLWWRRHNGPQSEDVSATSVRRVVTLSVAFALAMIFAALVAELDVLVLGAFDGARLAGLYAPISAVASFVVAAAPYVVGNWYLPVASRRLAEGNAPAVAAIYHFATRAGVAVAAPLLAVVIVCPGPALAVVFGHGISAEATALRIMGLGALVATVAGFNSTTLDAQGLARFTTIRLCVMIGLSVCLCLVLVPFFSVDGAALATAIALVAENVVCSFAVYRRLGIGPWDLRSGLVIAALGLSLFVGMLISGATTDNLLRCTLVALCAAIVTGGALAASSSVRGQSGRQQRFAYQSSGSSPRSSV